MSAHIRRAVAVICLAWAAPLAAQERLVVDHDAGREVVNDWTHAFLTHVFELDHTRRLIYAVEIGEPQLVKAFSITDGSLVATYGRGAGDGPGELRHMVQDVAATRSGMLVSDGSRINYWSLAADSAWTWRPGVSIAKYVCALGDDPVVPLRNGALRGPAGHEVRLGETGQPLGRAGSSVSLLAADGACMGDTAYFIADDSVIGYRPSGDAFAVQVPPEIRESVDDWRRSRPDGGRYTASYRGLSVDGQGRLLLTLVDQMRLPFAGALIDPFTGCYSLLLDERRAPQRSVVGVYGDSAVVYERGVSVREIEGRRGRVIEPEAFMIALRPLRPAGGEACRP